MIDVSRLDQWHGRAHVRRRISAPSSKSQAGLPRPDRLTPYSIVRVPTVIAPSTLGEDDARHGLYVELKALGDKARGLKPHATVGELVIATGATPQRRRTGGRADRRWLRRRILKEGDMGQAGLRSFRAVHGELHRQLSATGARQPGGTQPSTGTRHDMRAWQVSATSARHLIERAASSSRLVSWS
jgi:hypothetical protein